MEAAAIAHAEHHGPPPANRSSRVEPATLGMLLFIISEVMIFGAFFTAYFFIRVVNHDPWPAHGTLLPEAVAGINTAILLSSSLTLHWALVSVKNGNRFGLKAGMLSTFLLGLTFLTVQINEYVHIGFAPHDSGPGLGLLLPDRARTAPTSSSACACSPSSRSAPSAATTPPSRTGGWRCQASTGTSSTSCG